MVLGLYDRVTKNEGKPETYSIIQATRHPQYKAEGSYPNDIALLKTSETVIYNMYVMPIYLPEPGETFENLGCAITGNHHTK